MVALPFRANELLRFDLATANIEVGPNGMYAGGGVLGDAQALALPGRTWHLSTAPLASQVNFLNSPNDGGDWGANGSRFMRSHDRRPHFGAVDGIYELAVELLQPTT